VKWPGKVIEATFLRRYKRFLADFRLDDGSEVTAHCANTGSMKTCLKPGARAWITYHDDPKRKLAYSWQAIEMEDGWVGIHTSLANKLVKEAIDEGLVPELTGYGSLATERKYGRNSRIDLLLSEPGRPDCFVEVKNVTLLLAQNVVGFPDAVTARGLKHLHDLMEVVAGGSRAVLFYCVQRESAQVVQPARDFDPAYTAALAEAMAAGVEVVSYRARLTPEAVRLDRPLPLKND